MVQPGFRVQLRRGTTLKHQTFLGAEGEATIDTDKDTLIIHDGVLLGGHQMARADDIHVVRSITISEPMGVEDITIFRHDRPYTIKSIQAVVRGATPYVEWSLRFDPDRQALGTPIKTAGFLTTSQTGETYTEFDIEIVPADNWFWFEIDSVSGTIEEFHLTIDLEWQG